MLLCPDLWGGDNQLIMTETEIKAYNRALLDIPETGLTELAAFPMESTRETILGLMKPFPDAIRFLDGKLLTDYDRSALIAKQYREGIPSIVPTHYAVTCCPANLRAFPTEKAGTSEPYTPYEPRFDLFQETALPCGTPLLLLHATQDKTWHFVRSEDSCGWIHCSCFRFCDKPYFLARYRRRDCPIPYTSRNLYRYALSLAGTPYRWGKTDCSALVQRVYRRFGIRLPRNSSQMRSIHFHRHFISGDFPQLAPSLSPGTLLFFPGHVMLFLGIYEKKTYILHNFTRYSDADGVDHPVFSTAVTPLEGLYHRSGVSFPDRLTCAVEIRR